LQLPGGQLPATSIHSDGCDPCIKDNLQKKKMPACFFRAVHDDVSDAVDFSIEGFVNYFHKHNKCKGDSQENQDIKAGVNDPVKY
jgi:hypothetical protein